MCEPRVLRRDPSAHSPLQTSGLQVLATEEVRTLGDKVVHSVH